MYDDGIRSPRSEPTREERLWMAQDFGAMFVRSLALAVAAVCIGVSASVVMQPAAVPAAVASSAQGAD
jgi:hypothetical protein